MMRIKGSLLIAVLLIIMLPAAAFAVEVAEVVMCRDVVEREPVEPGDSFPADVGKVWCWSKIKDGRATVIKHVYYHNNKKMATVELFMGSALFRTWSSKRIMQDWKGEWRVDIVDDNDNLLKSLEFTIGKEMESE